MKILLLTSGMSPAEALWVDVLDDAGHTVDVFDTRSAQWLRRRAYHPAKVVPEWVRTWSYRSTGNALNSFYQLLVDGGEYDDVVASGLAAGGAMARHCERAFTPLLWRGDLDFSSARPVLAEDFAALTSATGRILLEDEYEFDKALAKGSNSAHLLHVQRPVGSLRPLLGPGAAASAEGPRVAVLHPEGMPEARVDAYRAMLDAVAERHGGTAEAVSAASLYRLRDAQRNRRFDDIASTRLAGFTHAVLIGVSRDHSTLADALLAPQTRDRFIVEDTIGMGYWADRAGFERTGRGARMGELLDGMLGSAESAAGGGAPAAVASAADVDPMVALRRTMERPVPRLHEELRALESEGPLDVFFSTSPLEDRTNGARPQRVRNMAEALDERGPAVRVYSTPKVFERRTDLIFRLLREGRPAGLLYGENSTSPIPFDTTLDGLERLFAAFRAAGGRSAWFVRDLHWLEKDADFLDDPERKQEFVERGLRELSIAGHGTDLLLAPCEASAEGFKGMLAGHDDTEYRWAAMPPAVAAANAVRPHASVSETTTLLYAGGVGSFYAMDSYLRAIISLPADRFRFDFLVRPAEVENLVRFLAAHGLEDDPRVSITTDELDVYTPRDGATIGTVLLDSEYARFAFPYKTVSMLEKGFPLLTYRDMAIAEFVESNGIGAVCERSAASVAETLETMSRHDYTDAIRSARVTESWTARIDRLESLLSAVRNDAVGKDREPASRS
ncbi:hypothetical protein GCM10022377_02700 [Zhihengliuella alba]|uniref:Glucosyltransferase 3-like C-terminal domain-containing protein n=1 Tax=Zhihengliuella alba TaxID=547018 RepID=A0ABP7CN17_9MICC